MSIKPVVIPLVQENMSSTACTSAGATETLGRCSSASSCTSSSGCASGGTDGNDHSAKLAQEGWMLRTTIGEPRLTEVVENYLAMGFEVYVDRFATTSTTQTYREGEESCTTCFDAADRSDANKAWGSVYVRNGKPTALLNKLY